MLSTKILVQKTGDKGEILESYEFSNSFTTLGLDSLDLLAEDPELPHHYITIGSDYDPNQEVIEEIVGTKQATVLLRETEPLDVETTPVLRTRTLSVQFGGYLNELEVRSLGISDAGGNMYTYTNVKDIEGRPITITLTRNENLYITYIYQISALRYLPQDLEVAGTGIPTGCKALLVRTESSPTRGYYYYANEQDYIDSNWEALYKSFYKDDTRNSKYGPDFGNKAFDDMTIAGSSTGVTAIKDFHSNLIPSFSTAPNDAVAIPAYSFFVDERTQYVVAFRIAPNYSIILNKAIPFTRTSQLALEVSLPYILDVVPYIDPREYE